MLEEPVAAIVQAAHQCTVEGLSIRWAEGHPRPDGRRNNTDVARVLEDLNSGQALAVDLDSGDRAISSSR